MPSLIERAAGLFGKVRQMRELRHRSAGRLFEQHMLALLERELGGVIMLLRRRADRDGVEIGAALEHRLDGLKIGDVARFAMAARRRGESEMAVGKNGRDMLIARDLSDTHDANIGWLHERFSVLPLLRVFGFKDCGYVSE